MSTFKFIKKIKIIALIALLASLNACGGKTNRDDDDPLEGSAPTHGRPNTGGNSRGSGGGNGNPGGQNIPPDPTGNPGNQPGGQPGPNPSGQPDASGNGQPAVEQPTQTEEELKEAEAQRLANLAKAKEEEERREAEEKEAAPKIAKIKEELEPKFRYRLVSRADLMDAYRKLEVPGKEGLYKNARSRMYEFIESYEHKSEREALAGASNAIPTGKNSAESIADKLSELDKRKKYLESEVGKEEIKAYDQARSEYDQKAREFADEIVKVVADNDIKDKSGYRRLRYGAVDVDASYVQSTGLYFEQQGFKKIISLKDLKAQLKDQSQFNLFAKVERLKTEKDDLWKGITELLEKHTSLAKLKRNFGDWRDLQDTKEIRAELEGKKLAAEAAKAKYNSLWDKFVDFVVTEPSKSK